LWWDTAAAPIAEAAIMISAAAWRIFFMTMTFLMLKPAARYF
jgi:hypothetical protein